MQQREPPFSWLETDGFNVVYSEPLCLVKGNVCVSVRVQHAAVRHLLMHVE